MPDVLRMRDIAWQGPRDLFSTQGLHLKLVAHAQAIPGSHWGDDEAGLIRDTLYARLDTPVHSVLHEGCHWLLMDDARRHTLHTDAGGTHTEENAVCYLQILLADQLPDVGCARMFADMDAWGYSFRLGSARRWFEEDATDAHEFLQQQAHRLLINLRVTQKLTHTHSIASLHINTPS